MFGLSTKEKVDRQIPGACKALHNLFKALLTACNAMIIKCERFHLIIIEIRYRHLNCPVQSGHHLLEFNLQQSIN